jgi:acyl carrier protein
VSRAFCANGDSVGNDIRNRVQKVFRDVFDDPTIIVTEHTTAADIPTWESLTHINLVVALEEEFGIQFTSAEVTSMSRVGDLFTLIEKKQ